MVASEGLRRVLSLMAEHELAQGNLSAAELLAMEVGRPPRGLRARLKAAEHDEERRLEDVERLRREHDPEVGRRTRALLTLFFGGLWTLAPFVGAIIDPGGRAQLVTASLWTGVFLVLGLGLAIRNRGAMTASRINRGLVGAVSVTLGAQLALNLGVYLAGVGVELMQIMRFLLWSVATAMVALTLERRLWPAAVAYLVGFLVCARWPDLNYRIMSACNLAFTCNAGWVWWPRPRARSGSVVGSAPRERDGSRRHSPP